MLIDRIRIKSPKTEEDFNSYYYLRWFILRKEFEDVYSKTRNINKHNSYILDQDGHNHTANQSLNMDWQFIAELKLFEKIKLTYEKN